MVVPLIVFALVTGGLACTAQDPSAYYVGGPFDVGRLPKGLEEISGMVASVQHKGLLWCHNDSGDEAVLYGLLPEVGIVTRLNVFVEGGERGTAVDWEDVAYDANKRILHVADIGDNNAVRPYVTIYSFDEPTESKLASKDAVDVRARRRNLVYPDGPRDAETLLCDPRDGTLYIVSKREKRNRLYRVPETGDTLIFEHDFSFFSATGGDVSVDGRHVLIRTYLFVFHWFLPPQISLAEATKVSPDTVRYEPEPQGEAVAFRADGSGYYSTSERENGGDAAPLWWYPRTSTADSANILRDVRRPSMAVVPTDTANVYLLRYTIPDRHNVNINVHNVLMWKIATLVEDTVESGVQERKIDLRPYRPGPVVVVLTTSGTTTSIVVPE